MPTGMHGCWNEGVPHTGGAQRFSLAAENPVINALGMFPVWFAV